MGDLFAESHPWTAAVLVDEFDAGSFEARRTAKSLATVTVAGLTSSTAKLAQLQ